MLTFLREWRAAMMPLVDILAASRAPNTLCAVQSLNELSTLEHRPYLSHWN
jgi:hypothetical protein